MSGFKQQQKDDGAVSLWSFDGDSYDPINRTTLSVPRMILDEIDNLNPAILHVDNELIHGYRMGMQSLVKLEPASQHSISFGYAGYQENHPSKWAKAFLEVPHSIDYRFPTNGSFSVEFLMNQSDFVQFRQKVGLYHGLSRPIIRKAGVFGIDLISPYYGVGDHFLITYPGGTLPIVSFSDDSMKSGTSSNARTASYLGRTLHIVLVWDVQEKASLGEYESWVRFYINGNLVSSAMKVYLDTIPITNVYSSIEIAGTSTGGGASFNDRATSPLQMDQIAIYDFALTTDQVNNHFRKTLDYRDLIISDRSENLWLFEEFESSNSTAFYDYEANGSIVGTSYGGPDRVLRRDIGLKGVVGSTSFRFREGGMVQIPRSIAIGNDYSIEFWFKLSSIGRGVLFSNQSSTYPFDGPLIQINWADNHFSPSRIQFSESSNGTTLNSIEYTAERGTMVYNDDQWHHIVAQRRGDLLELWLDGKLQSAVIVSRRNLTVSSISMMGMAPGYLHCDGNLTFLSLYNVALSEQQISNHYEYSTVYKIRGTVLLQGIPTKATLRFFKSISGEFLKEVTSDPTTGIYSVAFRDNSLIDIMVFDKTNRSVRYRAYGPVTPSEIDDFPIVL